MLYGGKPQKIIPPPKMGCPRNVEFKGPEPYTYSFLAKQPGSNYKIRLRDTERMRMERLKMIKEDNFKNLTKQIQHKEMIDVSDRKHVYYQIKRAVECGMKANAYLFKEERPKPKLTVENEPERPAKMTKEDLEEKAKQQKIIRDEKRRKIVEEKLLQQFIENSDELRIGDVAKRGKDISKLNYETIQENERVNKEQKIKKIELANLENLEIIKQQSLAKKDEQRKSLEKKQQFRNELHNQIQQLEKIKNQEKLLKKIECDELRTLNEQLNEEEKLKKLEHAKSHTQRNEDTKRIIDEKSKLFSKMKEEMTAFDHTLAITMAKNIQDDRTAEEVDNKIRLQLGNEKFLQRQAVFKEERNKENEEKYINIKKELKEINELKQTIEREKVEARRKRIKESDAIKEQLKIREILLKEQKDAKRKILEQSFKEHEEYLKEKKQLREDKKRLQLQYGKELNDQINWRKEMTTK